MKAGSIAAIVLSVVVVVTTLCLFLFYRPKGAPAPNSYQLNEEGTNVENVFAPPVRSVGSFTSVDQHVVPSVAGFGKAVWCNRKGTRLLVFAVEPGPWPQQGGFYWCSPGGAPKRIAVEVTTGWRCVQVGAVAQLTHPFAAVGLSSLESPNQGHVQVWRGDTFEARLEMPHHDVLKVRFDPDDDQVLYVTWVDGLNRGRLVLYHEIGDGTWEEKQTLVPMDSNLFDMFGHEVHIRPNLLTVSSAMNVKQYVRPARGSFWVHHATAFPPTGAGMLWGYQTAVSQDELLAFVSAPFDSIEDAEMAGQIYIFHRGDRNEQWQVHPETLKSPFGPRSGAYFGYRMHLLESVLLVTEAGDRRDLQNVFHVDVRDWKVQSWLSATLHDDCMEFGSAFAVGQDQHAVKLFVGETHKSQEGSGRLSTFSAPWKTASAGEPSVPQVTEEATLLREV